MATNNTTMQKQDAGSKLRGMIERAQTAFAAVLPKHMNAERVTRIAMSAITRDHKLAECEPATVLRCVMEAACVGLEVNTPAQHAYLIPRKNKGGFMECTLQFGYRGLIDLARRSGAVSEVEAHVVHERDVFECRQGTDKAIKHLPAMKNPGEVIAAYSSAWMAGPDRRWQAEVMTVEELNRIRERSPSSGSGPWVTDTSEMYRKTVVKRLCKYLPQTPELARAVEIDNAVETGEGYASSFDTMVADAKPPSTVTQLKDHLAKRGTVIEGEVADVPPTEALP
jgi:recombination protein RecT